MKQAPDSSALTYSRLLGARLNLHAGIRLGVVIALLFGSFFAKHILGIEELNMVALLALALAISFYNAIAYALTRKFRAPEESKVAHRRLEIIMYVAIVLDFLALTAAVGLVGGARSPFLIFYVMHVSLSCVLLERWEAITLTILAYLLLVALVMGEWAGWFHAAQPLGAVAGTGPLDGRFAITLLAAYGALFGIIVLLLLTLSEHLRAGERRVRDANTELAALSDLRRDFLHIALHNLQSPIGAVTMHLNNLQAGLGGELKEKQGHWVGRCLILLKGLNEFLQNFRLFNSLEADMIDAQTTEVNLASLLGKLVDELREMADANGHELVLELPDPPPLVWGIERLLREAIVNYIENAIKYTPEGGRIIVRVKPRPPIMRIEVQDNGIGIAEEDQERLFSEFTRLNRVGTPVAKVKGSGLGLSIVRRVAEKHGGQTSVESEPGRGSTFIIELPMPPDANPPPPPDSIQPPDANPPPPRDGGETE